jgi:hypothetical protein
MQYEEIEAPIEADPTGEAFKVAWAPDGETRGWLCGWDSGPVWSEDKGDAIWTAPEPARAIEQRFGKYRRDEGRIKLLEREPSYRQFKDHVGRDYWHHITS